MQENRIQHISDEVVNKLFLWAIPKSVTPNAVTYLRFITTPIVFWLLVESNYQWGIPAFIICASTDFIDGAMARKRDQVTTTGKIIDPLADKLLIASTLAAIGFDYFIVKLIVVFIILEFIIVLVYSRLLNTFGNPEGANSFGKIKMMLQTISIVILFMGIIKKDYGIIEIATWGLSISFVFAVISGYEQIRDRLYFFMSAK